MFLSDFFFFCQSTVLILRYCLMNTAVNRVVFCVRQNVSRFMQDRAR